MLRLLRGWGILPQAAVQIREVAKDLESAYTNAHEEVKVEEKAKKILKGKKKAEFQGMVEMVRMESGAGSSLAAPKSTAPPLASYPTAVLATTPVSPPQSPIRVKGSHLELNA